MENTVKGADAICARIVSEARTAAEAVIEKANAEAEKIIADAELSAARISEAIISKAEAEAEGAKERAFSTARVKRRDTLLKAKSEAMDKAFAEAEKKLLEADEETYCAVMSELLAKTAEAFLKNGETASALFGKKESGMSEKIMSEAKKKMKVTAELSAENGKISASGGFVLSKGDAEINCRIASVINSERAELEKTVSGILFPKSAEGKN